MKTAMRKGIKKAACLLFAGVLFAGTAFAEETLKWETDYSGPQSAKRSEEEWLRLRDNALEWDEIAGLVEEYNPQLLESFSSYRRQKESTRSAEDLTRDLNAQAEQLEDLAATYETETGGQLSAASLRLQAAELRESAEKNTSDWETLWLEMQEKRTAKEKEVRELFVSYHEACSDVSANQTEISRLQRNLSFLKAKKSKGKATDGDVRSAEENLSAAARKTALLEAKRDQTYRDLITSCGWTVDAQAQVGGLPAGESLMLTEEQHEGNLAKALENSYLLRADRIRLENARRIYGETEVTAGAEKTLAEDTAAVREAFLEAKQNYDSQAAASISAGQNLQLKQKALVLAEKQKASGFISEEALEAKKDAVNGARQSVTDALYGLIRARIAYDAAVEGAKS